MPEPLLEAFFQLDPANAGAVRAFCQRHGKADNVWWPELGPFPGSLPFRVQDEAFAKLSPAFAARLEAEWQEKARTAGEARALYLSKLKTKIRRLGSYGWIAADPIHQHLFGWEVPAERVMASKEISV